MPSYSNPDLIASEVRDLLQRRLGRVVPKARVVLTRVRPGVLAFVRAGENVIYLNEIPYRSFSGDVSQYLFVVILHEYLHLVGVADEREVRRITLDVIEETFGEDSTAYRLAQNLADPRDIYLRESWKQFGRPNTYM
jgi:hypothetical protein